MFDFICFLYICYGLYYAGSKFPFGLEIDDKFDFLEILLIGMFIIIAWPFAVGISKNKNVKKDTNKNA